MMRFARGLVVGKFCPLHHGHERVIDAALAACDEVFVLGYSRPEFVYCEPEERRRWFALRYPPSRFPRLRVIVLGEADVAAECTKRGVIGEIPELPHNDAADQTHRQFCAWVCETLFGHPVDAVFTSESYGDGFAAALSARFGRPVTHVAVDPSRREVPVSGSALREDPAAFRSRIAPEVYASLVPRIAVLGGESSGKTTLAHALAAALGAPIAEEYGRERWVAQGGGVLSAETLLQVAQVQVEREYAVAAQAEGFIVCDTTPLTTLFYCLADHGNADARLLALSQRRYALNLLCAPDFPFDQDGTRRDATFRDRQHAWYREQLALREATVLLVSGSVDERVRQVLHAIGRETGV